MRWSEKLDNVLLYFIILICGYLALVFWYFIARVIRQEGAQTADFLFDAFSSLIMVILLMLIFYLFYQVYRKFKH